MLQDSNVQNLKQVREREKKEGVHTNSQFSASKDHRHMQMSSRRGGLKVRSPRRPEIAPTPKPVTPMVQTPQKMVPAISAQTVLTTSTPVTTKAPIDNPPLPRLVTLSNGVRNMAANSSLVGFSYNEKIKLYFVHISKIYTKCSDTYLREFNVNISYVFIEFHRNCNFYQNYVCF